MSKVICNECETVAHCMKNGCVPKQPAQQEPVAVYGFCPERGAKGVQRERRLEGNDKCANGHIYPSSKSSSPPQRTWVGLTDEHRAMIQRGVDRTTPPFNPDWNTEAVLVEEMQRMAKRIEKLEATLERQTTRIVDLQTHIANLEGEE